MRDATPIGFREYSDREFPETLRVQVLSFLRIVWPDGFVGENRFRDQITDAEMDPQHLVYAAGSQLVSHLEVVSTTVSVGGITYAVQSPTTVLTFPAFRGEGWAGRLVDAATRRIDGSDADIGVLTCGRHLIDFYSRAGWVLADGATIVAGPDENTWTLDDVLLTRSIGPRSSQVLAGLHDHPLRIAGEW